ncbi:hypothetical protein CFREI_11515 [Corynebacterium freiburgense]|nr:hypothetical protein CFREI_11515 [Corynebacterium freiburgense]
MELQAICKFQSYWGFPGEAVMVSIIGSLKALGSSG